MSLKTRFGNLGNILDFDNLTKENIYVLDGPILSNSQFEKFLNYFGKNYKILDCTFSLEDDLENSLNRLKNQVEQIVREGIKGSWSIKGLSLCKWCSKTFSCFKSYECS